MLDLHPFRNAFVYSLGFQYHCHGPLLFDHVWKHRLTRPAASSLPPVWGDTPVPCHLWPRCYGETSPHVRRRAHPSAAPAPRLTKEKNGGRTSADALVAHSGCAVLACAGAPELALFVITIFLVISGARETPIPVCLCCLSFQQTAYACVSPFWQRSGCSPLLVSPSSIPGGNICKRLRPSWLCCWPRSPLEFHRTFIGTYASTAVLPCQYMMPALLSGNYGLVSIVNMRWHRTASRQFKTAGNPSRPKRTPTVLL